VDGCRRETDCSGAAPTLLDAKGTWLQPSPRHQFDRWVPSLAVVRDLTENFLDRYRLAAVIQAVEEDLRSFIRQFVAPYHGAESILGEKITEFRQRAVADGLLDPSVEALVDYLDFGDAFALLNRYRGMLPESLGKAVRSLTPAFEVAVPIRNRVMHGRPLLSADEEQVARLGQSAAEREPGFALTRRVVARLAEDPTWSPIMEITPTRYGNALHNLPLPEFDETGLLGRDKELRQVKELLLRRRYPVVTIAGEGGIGKTALAVQVLYDLVDSQDPPFDAVLCASLKTERLTGRGVEQIRDAGVDLMSLTDELSGVMGEGSSADVALLADLLAGTKTLIAVDNVESIAPDEMRELIDAVPDAQFLLTSRVGLGEIEWRITLASLASHPARLMLRQLAARRGLTHIARMSDRQAERVVDRLRGSPLAIRWFVEAVQVGGQPDALLHDQSSVLQFCMSSIYDSLAPEGQKLVECLVALETSASVGQLALLTDLERDEVQEQIYQLQRRAIVEVDSRLSESLTQSYSLGAMPHEYLRRFGSLDPKFSEHVHRQLREIAATDELIRRYDNKVALEPMAISVETPEERAVARVLRQALRESKRGELEAARAQVARARDAVPTFFETYRVEAFIESNHRPEEARRLYQEAYRLAPHDARPKVAYWLAGHLLNLRSAQEAERFARQAHGGLDLPGTALQLGRVCMYEGQRFDEAEQLLSQAATSDHAKTRLIAETQLLDLAKRRVEKHAHEERQPAAAMAAATGSLKRAERIVSSGVVDRRYDEAVVALIAESLLVALRMPDVSLVADPVGELLEFVDRHFAIVSRPGLRDEWAGRLRRLCSSPQCPEDIVLYGKKLETRLHQRLVMGKAGRTSGQIVEYSARKNYGFIRPSDGDDTVFFHKSSVEDSHDSLLLTRGVEVTYARHEQLHEGRPRARAKDLTVVISEQERERALRRRRGRVVHRAETYLLAEDIPTQERVFVHRSAFRDDRDWRDARIGQIIAADLEFGPQGPRALRRSAALDQDT
jgi:cold shock CspA family protein